MRSMGFLHRPLHSRYAEALGRAFGGPEHLILITVSSAGVLGAGVWDAQEEEDPEHHSHG
jgi:hypothetical protein